MTIKPYQDVDCEAFQLFFEDMKKRVPWAYEELDQNLTANKELIEKVGSGECCPIILAIDKDELLGFAALLRNRSPALSHRAKIFVGVKPEARDRGIGIALMEEVIFWARQHRLVRLELTVMANSRAALFLFHRFGFQIEGTRKKALFIEDQWTDEFYMGLLLNEGQTDEPK